MINIKRKKIDLNLVSRRNTKLPTYIKGNKTFLVLFIPFIYSY